MPQGHQSPLLSQSPGPALITQVEDHGVFIGQSAAERHGSSFALPVVACEISASAVAEREGWERWGQLGLFETTSWLLPPVSCLLSPDVWAKWGQLGSFASLRGGTR